MGEYVPDVASQLYIEQMYSTVLSTTGISGEDCLLVGGTPRDIVLGRLDPSEADADFLGPFDFGKIINKLPERVEAHYPKYRTLKLRIGPTLLDLTYCEPDRFLEIISDYDLNISKLVARPDGVIDDPFEVLESIRSGVLAADDAEKRILQDPSRILRIARFATLLNFGIDVELFAAMSNYSHLIPSTDHRDDLEKVLRLPDAQRVHAKKLLDDINSTVHHIDGPEELTTRLDSLKAKILTNTPVSKVRRILSGVEAAYLVGGATRDAIRDFPTKDFDFKVKTRLEDLVARLETLGYSRNADFHISESEYFLNERNGCISIVIDGEDIDLACVDTASIAELIKNGDVNLNCCAFDILNNSFVNPDIVSEIEEGKLSFCNPELVKKEPLIVVNALKHISRDPSVFPTEKALEIIFESLESVASLLTNNPELHYKIESVGGNVNTSEVVEIIENSQASDTAKKWLLEKIKAVQPRRYHVPGYSIAENLSTEEISRIIEFINDRYGQNVDDKKMSELFNGNQTIYVKTDDNNNIIGVFTLEGSRVYTTAALNSDEYRNMLARIRRHVPYPWATVDIGNRKVQALVTSAGFHQISNPFIANKLLAGKARAIQESLFGIVTTKSEKQQILYGK